MREYPIQDCGLKIYQPVMKHYADGRYPTIEETWDTGLNTEPCPKSELVSEMLTPSEIEQLRQEKKDANAYFLKAFARLKKK